MFKRLSIAVTILGAATVAFAAFAPAASAATPSRPDAVIAGRGLLTAHGAGVAAVKGLMDYHATADEGILLVKDIKGDAHADVDGYGGTAEWRGFKVYFGFHGSAHVVGSDVAVIVVGRGIDLQVAGRGWAYLKGDGTYRVNGGEPKPWTDAGAFAGIAPAPPSAPTP
jgi:hypothetical protein